MTIENPEVGTVAVIFAGAWLLGMLVLWVWHLTRGRPDSVQDSGKPDIVVAGSGKPPGYTSVDVGARQARSDLPRARPGKGHGERAGSWGPKEDDPNTKVKHWLDEEDHRRG